MIVPIGIKIKFRFGKKWTKTTWKKYFHLIWNQLKYMSDMLKTHYLQLFKLPNQKSWILVQHRKIIIWQAFCLFLYLFWWCVRLVSAKKQNNNLKKQILLSKTKRKTSNLKIRILKTIQMINNMTISAQTEIRKLEARFSLIRQQIMMGK